MLFSQPQIKGLVNKYRWGWAGAQRGWVTTFLAFLMGWVMLFSTPGRGGSSYFKPCILKYCKLQKPSVSLGGKSPCKIYIKLAGKGQLTKQNPTSCILEVYILFVENKSVDIQVELSYIEDLPESQT